MPEVHAHYSHMAQPKKFMMSPQGNKYKGTTPSLPRALGYLESDIKVVHVWQFSRATDTTDNWEKLCLLLAVLPLKIFLEPLYLQLH